MTWIKTNFLWMMFRCGWCSKPGQQRVLAIWLKRSAFDHYLAHALVRGSVTNFQGLHGLHTLAVPPHHTHAKLFADVTGSSQS